MNSNKLSGLKQEQIDNWIIKAINDAQIGQVANYIPQLALANPYWIALQIKTIEEETISAGDESLIFSLMSSIKPFLLLYLLSTLGESVFRWVDIEPSLQSFNSIEQLKADCGKPRNPMINSGAITLAGLLPGKDAAGKSKNLCNWLNENASSELFLDQVMLNSVKSVSNQANQAIAEELTIAGYLQDSDLALDTYNHICCLSGKISDVTALGLLLIKNPHPISAKYCTIVKALMMTCGLYQESGRFAVEVGLPSKSGVSGVVLSIVPSQGAIACYSPPLDQQGNSIGGLLLVREIVQSLNLSIFA